MGVKKISGLSAYKSKSINQVYTLRNIPEVNEVVDKSIEYEMIYDKDLERNRRSDPEVLVDAMPDGFVKDFVHYTRGFEAPTEFCLWSALFAVSSVGQRRLAVAHGPDPLVTNMFLVFIGSPGTVRKSTTIKRVEKLLLAIPHLYDDEATRKIFRVPIHTGKTTPEALYDMMQPEEVTIREPDMPESETLNLGSRMVLSADEMSHLMGKQQYNVGMSDVLLKLYDCKDYDEVATKKEGKIVFENIFFNLFAASTPDGFSSSVPDSAQGSGFLSRVILLQSTDSQREFAVPKSFKGEPTFEDMVCKLGWIGEFKTGVYKMTDEALNTFTRWYSGVKDMFRRGVYTDLHARIEIHAIKTAALIRAQAYDTSKVITKKDIILATQLVERSLDQKQEALGMVHSTPYQKTYGDIAKFIRKKQTVERKKLNSRFSRTYRMQDIDEVLRSLASAGRITCTIDGQHSPNVLKAADQEYHWVEG